MATKDEGYRYVPLTKTQLIAYAKKLHGSRSKLSWPEALKLAEQHERERAVNYAQLNDNLRRRNKFPRADGGRG